jgi:ribosomal protein L11 methylase PrmA
MAQRGSHATTTMTLKQQEQKAARPKARKRAKAARRK